MQPKNNRCHVHTRLNRLERMVIMQGITITVLVVTMLLVAWG